MRLERGLGPLRPVLVEGLAQVEGVGHGIEHGLGGHVRLRRVERGRELDVVGPELAREGDPVLDGLVRVLVAYLPRGQLLEGRGEHADLHELGLEGLHGHPGPPQAAMVMTVGDRGHYRPYGRSSTWAMIPPVPTEAMDEDDAARVHGDGGRSGKPRLATRRAGADREDPLFGGGGHRGWGGVLHLQAVQLRADDRLPALFGHLEPRAVGRRPGPSLEPRCARPRPTTSGCGRCSTTAGIKVSAYCTNFPNDVSAETLDRAFSGLRPPGCQGHDHLVREADPGPSRRRREPAPDEDRPPQPLERRRLVRQGGEGREGELRGARGLGGGLQGPLRVPGHQPRHRPLLRRRPRPFGLLQGSPGRASSRSM